MKYSFSIIPFSAAALLSTSAQAATVIDANGTMQTLSGTTQIIEGNLAGFPGTGKWASQLASGSDRTATTNATPSPTDFYVNYGTNLYSPTTTITLPASQYRYVKVDYNLGGGWLGTTHQLRLNSTGTAPAFVPFNSTGSIPATDGTHSIIIDLTDGGTPFAGNWNTFRWDFFNDAGNGGGKTFTIDKITYATAITPIPEPGSALLLSIAAAATLIRRRR